MTSQSRVCPCVPRRKQGRGLPEPHPATEVTCWETGCTGACPRSGVCLGNPLWGSWRSPGRLAWGRCSPHLLPAHETDSCQPHLGSSLKVCSLARQQWQLSAPVCEMGRARPCQRERDSCSEVTRRDREPQPRHCPHECRGETPARGAVGRAQPRPSGHHAKWVFVCLKLWPGSLFF